MAWPRKRQYSTDALAISARARRGARNTRTADERLRGCWEHDPLVLPMPGERAALYRAWSSASGWSSRPPGRWIQPRPTPDLSCRACSRLPRSGREVEVGEGGLASGLLTVLAISTYLLASFARTITSLEWFQYASPFYYTDSDRLFVDGPIWAHVFGMLIAAGATLVLALLAFRGREIGVATWWRSATGVHEHRRPSNHPVEALERGAWDYVACEAAGVPKGTFEEWMPRGRADREADRDTEYSRFSGLVERARALARMQREIAVAQMDPLSWLTKGPGRERPGRPGWGTKVTEDRDLEGPMRATFDVERASGGIELH